MLCKICGDVLIAAPKISPFLSICRFYKTHYEVLNLARSCTGKDIKDAFIKLSKEHHPDVNKSKLSHQRFQQINEAYKVLGKADSRRDYDLGLAIVEKHPYVHRPEMDESHEGFSSQRKNPYDDPLFWPNRDKTRDKFYRNEPYYGIDGVPRLPNAAILMCCLLLSLVGVGLQCLLLTKSYTFKREALIKKSLETEKQLKETRDAARNNGNTAQVEALRVRLLGQLNGPNDK